MRGKYQDNLENMQWFKSFFERNYAGQPYDPTPRRARGRGADSVAAFSLDAAKRGPAHSDAAEENTAPVRAPAKAAAKASAPSAASSSSAAAAGGGSAPPSAPSSRAGTAAGGGKPAGLAASVRHVSSPAGAGSATSSNQLEAARSKIGELSEQVAELRGSVEGLEKERDFYFGKLRDVEVLLQGYEGPGKSTVDAIFKILYATDDDFVAVDENGAPVTEGGAGDGE